MESLSESPRHSSLTTEKRVVTDLWNRWFIAIWQRLNRLGAPNLVSAPSYANDAAAAAAGVEIGEFYRNGSVVQCRIT